MPASRKTSSPKRDGGKKKQGGKPSDTRPIRREIGALICFVLAVFTFLGLFNAEAWLIDFLCGAVRMVIGWGYTFLPFTLTVAAVLLLFHRGRPVFARVLCCMLFPVLMGMMYHLFAVENLPWEKETLQYFLETGRQSKSGGFLCGVIVQALRPAISLPGTFILTLAGIVAVIFAVFRINPVSLFDAFRSRPRPEYQETEKPARIRPARPPREEKPPRPQKTGQKNRPDFDVPLYGESEEQESLPVGKLAQKSEEVKTPAEALCEPPAPVPIPQVFNFEDKAPAIIPEPLPPINPPEPVPPPLPPEPPVLEIHQEESAEFVLEDTPLPRPYQRPPVSLLSVRQGQSVDSSEELRQGAERLITALSNFSIGASISHVTRGPSVTRYEIELESGVRLSSLQNRADDVALALGAVSVNVAPVMGKVNVVGVEVPNRLVTTVTIRELIESSQFEEMEKPTSFVVGRDIAGNNITADLQKLVHLLIAGTTGSGKSVCINSIIVSLLYKASPEDLKFIMVDPKMVELGMYNGIPHLLTPVVSDSRQAAEALDWAVVEMDNRYKTLMENGKRDIDSYNLSVRGNPEIKPLPRIVIIIDEMADLMMVARKEVETAVARIAQKARACGVHLILATQRPEAKVVTGIIKANIPSRIALSVRSGLDSRIVLDETGAEKLVGRGDMLFLPNGAPRSTRVQGCWVDDREVSSVVEFLRTQSAPQYSEAIQAHLENAGREKPASGTMSGTADFISEEDPMLPAAIEIMIESGQGSVSYLQRRLKLGYARAARLMDMMEERQIVGPFEGSKPRQVLITPDEWEKMKGGGDL